MKSNHDKALEFYKRNQDDLVAKYNGKTLIFCNEDILDVKDSFSEAYSFAVEKFGIGNFTLQEVSAGSGSYTSFVATPGVISFA